MSEGNPTSAIDVLIVQVGDLRSDIRDMRDDLKDLTDTKVSYREWSQRNSEVNGRFTGLGREVSDLRAQIAAKSAPWWSVGSLLVAVTALAWSVFKI